MSESNAVFTQNELQIFCTRMSKKNNSVLYKLEKYLDKPLISDSELVEIRDIILTVSAEISRLPSNLIIGDKDERL